MGFKFLGEIRDRQVIIMVGTAATHNFISKELVAELQIPVERTRSYRVGYGAKGEEVCNNVVVKTHGIEIIQRFFPIKLGIADVVLGCEWLNCLDTYAFHSGPTMLMSLEWLGQRVTLQSDLSLTKGMEIGVIMLQWGEEEDDDHHHNHHDEPCNKQDELRREVPVLNEKLRSLELKINAVRDLMMDVIASLPQREEGDELLQRGQALAGGGGGAEKLSQRRLELPVFSGEDPCGWVLKVEKYFMLNGIGDEEKVAYASLSMKGEALNWLLAMEARKDIHDWEMFKHELMERFQPIRQFEQLMSLKQTTTVAHYKEQFELLSAPIINDISEEMLICIFTNGLNDDIKVELKYYGIGNLVKAMSRALQIEKDFKISDMMDEDKCVSAFERLLSLRQSTTVADYIDRFQFLSERIMRHMSEDMLIHTFINGLNDDKVKAKVNSAGLRDLAQVISLAQEMEDRNKTSSMMGETQKLSMDSDLATKPHSFKFLGKIGYREVIVLISSATTRNLISKEVVSALRISEQTGPEAEGGKACKCIVLKAQGVEIVQRFYPSKLRTADVVLGGEWLGSLGSYAIRGSPMSITFNRLGCTVTLQADPSLTTGLDTEVKTLVEWEVL